jgi:DNA repair exonuclease SbcCD nuclease subunit
MVSFLHAADLHLGMRITRFDPAMAGKIREGRLTALDNIRRVARERKVDFVLIAGDLFDDSAVDALTARRCFEMLDDLPMPVFVLTGNHDPLLAGGVWDRPPWNQQASRRVRLMRVCEPVGCGNGAELFPCPVLRKTCMSDPTRWIKEAAVDSGKIRIGVAHGSLKTRDDLPLEDHLISRHAATELQLDYLALGHWHGRQFFPDHAGVNRTAYSGVHEPMRFQGGADGQVGWTPHSGGGHAEFLDSGSGEVLHVRIAGPGAPPEIVPVQVGHFSWQEEQRELTSQPELEQLINEIATRPERERRLLRLKVTGVLDAASMLRLDELREILGHRYCLGELDDAGLHVQPTPEEMQEVVGPGVLRRVLEILQQEARSLDPATQRTAERAILVLYQLAKESQA